MTEHPNFDKKESELQVKKQHEEWNKQKQEWDKQHPPRDTTSKEVTGPKIIQMTFNGMTLKHLLNADIPLKEYLIDRIIPKDGLVYLYGPPASFKTNWLLYATLCAVNGDDVFEYKVKKPIRVAWIDEENRQIGMHDKLTKISKGMNFNVDTIEGELIVFYSNEFNLMHPDDIQRLEKLIEKYKFDLVVIDSIAKVFPYDERNETDVKKIYARLSPLISKYGVTFVLIHHCRKLAQNQTSRGMEDISGSREFGAMADSMIYLQSIGENKFLLKQTKNRYDKNVEAINFEVEGDDNTLKISYVGTVKEHFKKIEEKCADEIMDWCCSNPQEVYKTAELVETMKAKGYKRSSILNAKDILVKRKTFTKQGHGVYKWNYGDAK